MPDVGFIPLTKGHAFYLRVYILQNMIHQYWKQNLIVTGVTYIFVSKTNKSTLQFFMYLVVSTELPNHFNFSAPVEAAAISRLTEISKQMHLT